ncbi:MULTISPECIES: alpha/beta hydrolase [Pandoraea]|uniref:alpha/beta hydrolase n=1 Tax=Pandoraea TaxID=93217 RepID=UPI001F5CFF48|nr:MULTISPECIES: alpha/beta hydrolase [Pandoraea]MCI3208326.1 alpha/beta hydrolase [Pandoraea sp. LA3]MDN4586355.1 alpha/beta hydrolase [Pandoraea capi]
MSANAKSKSGQAGKSGSPGSSDQVFRTDDGLRIEEVSIEGHVAPVTLRLYRPVGKSTASTAAESSAATGQPGVVVPLEAHLPAVLYFHGGGFCRGSLDDGDAAARYLALNVPALVVSVGYSLAPEHPFPAAPEDAWCAALWLQRNARRYGASPRRLAVAGHDSGGNIAAALTMIARDRGEISISAQALLAPLLDPSMTRLADGGTPSDIEANECARCYRAYLPHATQRLHPYAAPLESRRLAGLPPTLIASAEHDLLHVEAEKYAAELIAAGVPTQVTRHRSASHYGLAALPAALRDVATFLTRRLAPPATGSTQ